MKEIEFADAKEKESTNWRMLSDRENSTDEKTLKIRKRCLFTVCCYFSVLEVNRLFYTLVLRCLSGKQTQEDTNTQG